MAELVISVSLRIDPAKREEATAAALEVMRATRAEPGCKAYVFSTDLEDPSRINVFEHWESQAALEGHFKSPHMAVFQKKMGAFGVKDMKAERFEVTKAGPLR